VAVRANIGIDGNDAELIDISHIPLTAWPSVWLPLFRRDYRGRGLGTLLLRRMLSELKTHGVCRISGRIAGEDVERLKRWYRSEGFHVDDQTLEIWREI
jgi:GNAT superfamily N-acetyltransferase